MRKDRYASAEDRGERPTPDEGLLPQRQATDGREPINVCCANLRIPTRSVVAARDMKGRRTNRRGPGLIVLPVEAVTVDVQFGGRAEHGGPLVFLSPQRWQGGYFFTAMLETFRNGCGENRVRA